MIYTNKLKKAIHFASIAHKNQKRKILDYPYISHPLSVVFLVSKFTENEDVLMASVLHDTVEDTDITLEDIEKGFGKNVRDIVEILTEDKSIQDKQQRKNKQLEKFKKANNEILLIKLADIIHNFCDILLVLENYPIETYLNVFGGGIKDKIESSKGRLDVIENTWLDNPLLPEAKLRFEDYKNILKKLDLMNV